MDPNIKQLPYGISDFDRTIRQNYYYVDKTPFLPKLEAAASFILFVRPRRFGKSLLVSMMKAYYDKARAEDFDKLFGGLWVGQHPTPWRARYQVLHLDFSRVTGTSETLPKTCNDYGCMVMNDFIQRYAADYDQRIVDKIFGETDFGAQLNLIDTAAKTRAIPLYLILDEYDNFTNDVLNEEGQEIYHAMTHAEGFYRGLFKKFKGMFERIFMTGVSPVTLNDLTSGYNIGTTISLDPEFNNLLGFTTSDVRDMLRYYKQAGALSDAIDVEETIKLMEPWYDNYCFAAASLAEPDRVFNTNMVLYFLRHLLRRGCAPEHMLDSNILTDYRKLWNLLKLDHFDGNRQGALRTAAETGQLIVKEIEPMFPASCITEPGTFPSLLYYYGMLTMTGTRGPRLILGIPNNAVRQQYFAFLLDECKKRARVDTDRLADAYDAMALDGQWRDALAIIADAYHQTSSVRDAIEGERNIQGFFMAYLSLNPYCLCAPEVELQHGYCDFFLLPDLTHYASYHSYILELKYLPKKDFDAQAAAQWAAAVEQIHGYARGPRVQALRQDTQLHCIVVQFCGWELARMEEV